MVPSIVELVSQAAIWVCDTIHHHPCPCLNSLRITDVEASIIKSFMSDMELGPMEINALNKQLEYFMRTDMESRNLVCDQLERTLHPAASLTEVLIHRCNLFCVQEY